MQDHLWILNMSNYIHNHPYDAFTTRELEWVRIEMRWNLNEELEL